MSSQKYDVNVRQQCDAGGRGSCCPEAWRRRGPGARMGLGPRSAHKARRQFPGAGRRGRAAPGSGRPPPGRDGCPRPPAAAARGEQAPEALPHLSPDALGYFRRALSALKEAPDAAEERGRSSHAVE